MNAVSNDIIARVANYIQSEAIEYIEWEDYLADITQEQFDAAIDAYNGMSQAELDRIVNEYEAERIRKYQASPEYQEWLKEKELLDENECPF